MIAGCGHKIFVMTKKVSTISLQVDAISRPDLLRFLSAKAEARQSSYVCVANVHMLVEAHQSPEFASIVNGADIVLADGMPLVWYNRIINNITQERIAGMDLLPEVLAHAEKLGQSVYFFGGTDDMLAKNREFLNATYPSLRIAGMLSPPFRPLTATEEDEVVRNINDTGASWVFVVLGCPKQERWMGRMKGKINAVMLGIGGALPVMIKWQKRAPLWMQKAGMEWVFRLGQEPKRLFKRYFTTGSVFFYLSLRDIVNKKLLGRKK